MVQTNLKRFGQGAVPVARPESMGDYHLDPREFYPPRISHTIHSPEIAAAIREANYLRDDPVAFSRVVVQLNTARGYRDKLRVSCAPQLLPFHVANRSFIDNGQPVHPEIIKAKSEALTAPHSPYGADEVTRLAVGLMKLEFGIHARTWLMSTGTLANALGLRAIVSPRGSILCAESAHIFVNEGNAIQTQMIPLKTLDGKLTPEILSAALQQRSGPQAVHGTVPEVVFISNTTEIGTVYSKEELAELGRFCLEHCMHFWIDGARLIHASVAEGKTLREITTDIGASVVTIGLDKIGGSDGAVLLFLGEEGMEGDFHGLAKSGGAIRSSVRELSSQVVKLFENNLAAQNCEVANTFANILGEKFRSAGFDLARAVESNAVFVDLPGGVARELLREGFSFSYPWEGVARFMLSYAHSESDLDEVVARAAYAAKNVVF